MTTLRKRRHGRKCKLYYNTGTADAPTWVLISKVGDVSAKFAKAMAESSDRESDFAADVPGHKKITLSAKYAKRFGAADTVFSALTNSYYNDATLDLAIADGDIATSGTYYTRGPFVVSSMEDSQPGAGAQEFNFEFAPVFDDDVTFSEHTVA